MAAVAAVQSARRAVLLGAGASAPAGIPTAQTMLPVIRAELAERPTWRIAGPAFDSALGALRQVQARRADPFTDPDVEILYAALVELAERDVALLSAFVTGWSQSITDAERPNLQPYVQYASRALEEDLGEILPGELSPGRGPCPGSISGCLGRFRAALSDLMGVAYSGLERPFRTAANEMLVLLPELCWIYDEAKVSYLAPLIESSRTRALWIATLNFDNTVETAAKRAHVPVDMGLSSQTGSIEFTIDSQLALAKLHGSLDWPMDDPWRVTSKPTPDGFSRTIFDAGNKLRVDGPFLDVLLAFRQALDGAKTLEVCGYSFRDAHVNHTILRWLSLGDDRRVKVFDPHMTDDMLMQNVNKNVGLSMPTGNTVSVPSKFLKERIELNNLSVAEWAALP